MRVSRTPSHVWEEAIIIRCLQFYNKQEREERIYLRF